MPFFSIVIPLFNKRRFIDRCLDSVKRQTFGDYEVVVVDDGSTDGGPDLVTARQDAKVRLVQQPNGGVSAARNRGIAEANGPWIAFLDADDEYLPEFLQKAAETIRRFPSAGVVYARVKWMKGALQVCLARDGVAEPTLLDDYLRFVARDRGFEMHSSVTVVRRDVFERVGTFPVGVKVGEDSDMWLRAAWVSPIAYIPEDLAIYHMEAGDSGWEKQAGSDPFWVRTYRQWLACGRIPPARLASSEAYYLKYVLDRAMAKALRHERRNALADWRSAAFRANAPRALSAKVLAVSLAPRPVVAAWARRIRGP